MRTKGKVPAKFTMCMLMVTLALATFTANAQSYRVEGEFNFRIIRWLNTGDSSYNSLNARYDVRELNVRARASHRDAELGIYVDGVLAQRLTVFQNSFHQDYQMQFVNGVVGSRIEVRHLGGGSVNLESLKAGVCSPVFISPPPVVIVNPTPTPRPPRPSLEDLAIKYPEVRRYFSSNQAGDFARAVRHIADELRPNLSYEKQVYVYDVIQKASIVQIKSSASVLGGEVRGSLLQLVLEIDSRPDIIHELLRTDNTRDIAIALMGLKEVILSQLAPLSRSEYERIYGPQWIP